MAQIIGLDTASEIWTALEKIFSAASKARIMQLRFQLQTTKKEGLSKMEYLLKIKFVVDNLVAIGEKLQNKIEFSIYLQDLEQSIIRLSFQLLLGMNH